MSLPMWCLYQCDVFTNVVSLQMWCLYKCGVFINVVSLPMWCLYLCGVFTNVVSLPMWCIYQCDVFTNVMSLHIHCPYQSAAMCCLQQKTLNSTLGTASFKPTTVIPHRVIQADRKVDYAGTLDSPYCNLTYVGQILDDRLKEKNPETLRGCPQ